MSEEYGGDIYSISDENGNEYELEHLDTIEYNGEYYLAFLPADIDENSDDFGMLIMKNEQDENGDEYLAIPDDDTQQKVYDLFMERLFADEEEDEE